VFRVGILRQWTFLFLLCADETLAFPVLQYHWTYGTYFWIYWINAAVQAILFVGLAYEVLQSIPGYDIVSLRTRTTFMGGSVTAGIIFTFISGLPTAKPILDLVLILNRCVTSAWVVVLMCCIGGICFVGYGFTLTGVRIATGVGLRLLSGMGAATAFTSHLTPAIKATINALDTTVGLCVAAYWCFAAMNAPKADADFQADWTAHRHLLLPPTEKDG
jgi:hypothetical protein